jgi:hypothetical protein
MRDMGRAMMGTGEAMGEGRAKGGGSGHRKPASRRSCDWRQGVLVSISAAWI